MKNEKINQLFLCTCVEVAKVLMVFRWEKMMPKKSPPKIPSKRWKSVEETPSFSTCSLNVMSRRIHTFCPVGHGDFLNAM